MNLSAIFKADRIDNKMVVYSLNAAVVMCIQMRGDQNLVSRKRLPGKFQTNAVGFFVRLNFPRQKGLHILIEVSAAGFAVKIFGCHELVISVHPSAVDTADILPSVFVNGFLLLHAIVDATTHGTRCLFAFLDKNNRCHRTSTSTLYHHIGVGVQPVDCLIAPTDAVSRRGQIDRPHHALMRKHGELIEISADAFQLMKVLQSDRLSYRVQRCEGIHRCPCRYRRQSFQLLSILCLSPKRTFFCFVCDLVWSNNNHLHSVIKVGGA